MPTTVWTIGHSTRTLDEFARILEVHEVEAVVDIRRFPGSRLLPHFGSEALATALATRQVAYRWLPALGGRRRTADASASSAWRNASFAAYADYMATEEFSEGLSELLGIAFGLRTAMMCAELLWWRCHRRLVSDVLVSLGLTVLHIRDASNAERHRIVPPAQLAGGVLRYPLVR